MSTTTQGSSLHQIPGSHWNISVGTSSPQTSRCLLKFLKILIITQLLDYLKPYNYRLSWIITYLKKILTTIVQFFCSVILFREVWTMWIWGKIFFRQKSLVKVSRLVLPLMEGFPLACHQLCCQSRRDVSSLNHSLEIWSCSPLSFSNLFS